MIDSLNSAPAAAPSGGPLFRPVPIGVHVRAIRPEDRTACRAFGGHLTPDDLRLRFASPRRFDDGICRSLFEIDEERDTVLAAMDEDEEVLGIGRLARISSDEAEFALIVRSDLKGLGIGARLLAALVDRGRAIGCRAVVGDMLYENLRMRRLAASFGFRATDGVGLMIRMRLALDTIADPHACAFPF
jgi:acetyltransferase